MRYLPCLLVAIVACARSESDSPRAAQTPQDSTRRAFADTIAALLLDTTFLELRAHLFVKIPNPDRQDESPLADREVPHAPEPGPHLMDGKLYAELGVLQDLLGRDVAVRVDTVRDHVFVGAPPVLLVAHQHGTRRTSP